MRRIVLPAVTNVVRAVDEEIVVAPIASAAPIIAPTAQRETSAEGYPGGDDAGADIRWRAKIVGRIVRIRPIAVDCRRLVIGNVHHVGIGWLDHDRLLALLLLNRNLLLLGRGQLVVRLGP